MSKECGGVWLPRDWYRSIREDRRKFFSEAREQMDIVPNPTILNETDSLDEDVDSDDCDVGSVCSMVEPVVNENETIFELLISQEQWQKIKPVVSSSTKKRTTHTSKPHVWTNIIAEEFYKQHRLPCAFHFKRAEVNTSTERRHFLKIKGYCIDEDCKNLFFGYADQEPCDHLEFLIKVRTRNTLFDNHAEVKRVVNGLRREEIGKACVAEGCHVTQKRLARELLKRGDTEGPIIPSLDVLRQVKHEVNDKNLKIKKSDGNDLIQTIFSMQYEQPFIGSIQDVAYNPFFCFYGTPEQKTTSLQYWNQTKDFSKVTIDASASMMQKLKRPHGLKSAHLFLYCIVIHFDNKILSDYQMVSESQETEAIEFWLKRWIRQVTRKPKEVVTDFSRALLSACSKAFNYVTLKKYIDHAFDSITQNGGVATEFASTYIRVDVAHFIHMVCRWKCLKDHPSRPVRDFLIRCIALLVDCQNLADFCEVFGLLCVLTLQNYEDTEVCVEISNSARDARRKLENIIKVRRLDVNGYLAILDDGGKPVEYTPTVDSDHLVNSQSPIASFIGHLIDKAAVEKGVGTDVNAYRLPVLVDQLRRIGKEFPLWSAVGMPYFVDHATSSPSESNFENIKNKVLKNSSNSLRVDRFLKKHILDLLGATRIMSSKLLNARIRRSPPLERKKKRRLIHLQNSLQKWRKIQILSSH